ncbi:glycosyltransferase family 2 protein [uncultured Desulfovibrio sp.]|uniref:glycosyltransferase family 2 protein n=1 Tax=uncultured Desulfovibrio sp. TaxID=167968 RepID=UPI002080534C|nr:glycosyltransferase family 2 protein [uncultured Desulfovibrio sp.]GKG93725.1 glycosyl transferase family 2 [Desulfovibrionaceae bacterium]GKI12277.1 glycosyl transferase family 2 [Desulfovibrionaceae bacterium]
MSSAAAPLVSVILPVYNAASGLGAALSSLWAQRPAPGAPLPPFEVLAVDDGSTDHSPALLEAAARREPRLRVLRRPHQGIAATLNAGLAAARGRYLARMDADDTTHPERLARQVAHLDADPGLHLSAGMVDFGGDAVRAGGFAHFVDWQNSLRSSEDIARNRFRDTPVCHPSVMFRRAAVERWGGYADGDFAEDWELWLRWLDAGARLEKLPLRLLTWNDPPGRATRADARYREAACNELRALWLARELARSNPFHPEVWVLGAGRVARRRLAPLRRLGVRPAAYIDIDPRKIGNRPGGIAVLPRAALPGPGRCRILNALTAHGAAEEAARWLSEAGYGPEDWWLS